MILLLLSAATPQVSPAAPAVRFIIIMTRRLPVRHAQPRQRAVREAAAATPRDASRSPSCAAVTICRRGTRYCASQPGARRAIIIMRARYRRAPPRLTTRRAAARVAARRQRHHRRRLATMMPPRRHAHAPATPPNAKTPRYYIIRAR